MLLKMGFKIDNFRTQGAKNTLNTNNFFFFDTTLNTNLKGTKGIFV